MCVCVCVCVRVCICMCMCTRVHVCVACISFCLSASRNIWKICHASSVIIRHLASVFCHAYIYIYIHIYVCTTNQMSPADIDKILHVNIRNCGFHLRSVKCFQLNISRRLSFSIYSFRYWRRREPPVLLSCGDSFSSFWFSHCIGKDNRTSFYSSRTAPTEDFWQ